jgi:hypothetical protein
MFKAFFFFSAGFVGGVAFVVHELVTERMIVNNNPDGSVHIHYNKKRSPEA